MATRGVTRTLPSILFALAGLSLAASAAAQVPERMALQFDHRSFGQGRRETSESMKRRIQTHLVPLLEGLGYTVHPVDSARKAIRTGDFHAAMKIHVDARPIYLVHEARQFGRHVESQHDTGVSAWADFELYGWKRHDQFSHAHVGPIDSRVHDAPAGGRPIIDDEDSVARVFASEVADLVADHIRAYEEPPEDESDDE